MGADRILLVEDDKEIREGVEIFLRSQGYQVFQAADGLEGLKLLEQEEVQLAIVDVMMPRMDGITMVVKLREMYDFQVIGFTIGSKKITDTLDGKYTNQVETLIGAAKGKVEIGRAHV